MGKKQKFDFQKLITGKYVGTGEKFYFISDQSFHATLEKSPAGDYKFFYEGNYYTPHALAVTWLGMEPSNTALHWIRTGYDRTLFEIWEDYLQGVEPYENAA